MGKSKMKYAPALLRGPSLTPAEIARLIVRYGIRCGCILIPLGIDGLKVVVPHPDDLNHALKMLEVE